MPTCDFWREISSILRLPSSLDRPRLGRLVLLLLYCLAYWLGLFWLLR